MSKNTCDVAVIGGGVIGLACAWRLAGRGAKVQLFERGQTGREASWAAAGMLAPQLEAAVHPPEAGSDRSAFFDLYLQSRALYAPFAHELEAQTGHDVELHLEADSEVTLGRGGVMPGILFVGENAQDPTLAVLRAQSASGLRVQSASEARGLWSLQKAYGGPRINFSQDAALWLPNEGQVSPRLLCKALRKAIINAGVEVHQAEPARRIIPGGGDFEIVTSQGTYRSSKVLVCAGAWSSRMEGLPAEVLPPVHPVAGQVLAVRYTKIQDEYWSHWLRYLIYSRACYLVPRSDGLILVGATMENRGFRKRPTIGGAQQLMAAASHLSPLIRESTLEAHWAGLRPATPDGLPVLGHTSQPGLFVATGHFRNGILLTPVTAQLMADCILENQAAPREFSMERFEAAVLAS